MAARCVSAQPVAPTGKAMPPESRSRCVSYGVLRLAAPVATAASNTTILAKLLREQIVRWSTCSCWQGAEVHRRETA